MPPIIPNDVPDHWPAGTTVKYTRTLNDFLPSDGWAYTIYFNGPVQNFSKAAAVVNNQFVVELTPADTNVAAGAYRYCERLVNAGLGQTYDITGDELVVNIEPNLATAAPGAFLTHAEKTLGVIEAALNGRLTADIERYQVAGRSVDKIPISELLKLRGYYASMVWRAQHPGKLGVPYEVEFDLEQETQFPPTWTDVTGLEP